MAATSTPYTPRFVAPAVTDANDYIVQSLERISSGFDSGVQDLNSRVQATLATAQANPSDPKALADFQSAIGDLTTFRAAQSSTIKTFKDMATEIIRNF